MRFKNNPAGKAQGRSLWEPEAWILSEAGWARDRRGMQVDTRCETRQPLSRTARRTRARLCSLALTTLLAHRLTAAWKAGHARITCHECGDMIP